MQDLREGRQAWRIWDLQKLPENQNMSEQTLLEKAKVVQVRKERVSRIYTDIEQEQRLELTLAWYSRVVKV